MFISVIIVRLHYFFDTAVNVGGYLSLQLR